MATARAGAVSLLVLDAVDKQAEVRCGRGVGERSGREKIGAGFRIGAGVIQRDPAGNLYDAILVDAAGHLHAVARFLKRHVVEQHGLRAGFEGFVEFLLVAYLDLDS